MPELVLGTCTTSSASGYIKELSSPWSYTYYLEACLKVTFNGNTNTSPPVYPTGSGNDTQEMTVTGTFVYSGTYSVLARARAANGTWYDAGSGSFVVPYIPYISSAYQPTAGTKTIYVAWGNTTSGATYTIYTRLSGTSTWYYKATSSGSSVTISVDTFDDYDVAVAASIDGRSAPSYGSMTDITVINLPTLATPSITSSSVTTSSISVTLSDVDADVYYANIDGGSYQSGSGRAFSFTGLNSGQTYAIRYKATKSGYNDSAVGGPTSITTATNSKPDPWSWTTSNGAASDAVTLAAYYAVSKVSGYDLSDFSYVVWNDLVDKIDAFCVYQGKTITNSAARMNSGSRVLTADRFNYILTAIHQMVATGIAAQSPTNVVFGSYFTTITQALNSIQ